MNRTGLLIATSLVAFILVGFSLVVPLIGPATVGQPSSLAQPASTDSAAVYQQALAEARAKLEQANAQIMDANARLRQQNQSVPTANTALADSTTYALTAEQASAAALQASPGAKLMHTPEVVDYQGAPAYEVVLDQGMFYIDAQTGALLYNGVAAQHPQRGEAYAEDAEHEADEHEGQRDEYE